MQQIKFANPKLQRFDIAIKPRTTRQMLLGISLEIIALAIAGLILYVCYRIYSDLIADYYSKPTHAESIGQSLISLIMFFWWIFIIVVIPIRRRARRYLVNAQSKLEKDASDPILYLRSFADDYSGNAERRDKKTDEELLVPVLEGSGPVITVGEPNEDQLVLGAIRIYLKNENWQVDVQDLMSISQLVVINANISKGLQWELKNARTKLEPQKLLISFLSWQEQDEVSKQALYERFKAHAEISLRCSMPESPGDACFMYFESDWTCKLIEISEDEKIVFGGINFFSFRKSSPFSLKVSTGAIRESLRQVLARCGLKLGMWESFLHIVKFLLLIIGWFIFLTHYPGLGGGILAGLGTLLIYSIIGNRATKPDIVSLNITSSAPNPRKNKLG
jgi:hypothetical protein